MVMLKNLFFSETDSQSLVDPIVAETKQNALELMEIELENPSKSYEFLEMFVEPFLIVINPREALEFESQAEEQETKIPLSLRHFLSDLEKLFAKWYGIEGAEDTSIEMSIMESVCSISRYQNLIIRVKYRSINRISISRLNLNEFAEKSRDELEKNLLKNNVFRQFMASSSTLTNLNRRKNEINNRILSLVPLQYLDQNQFWSESPSMSAWQPKVYQIKK
jgi:hypothetical protein